MKNSIKIKTDCNYDFYEDIAKFLISVPHPEILTTCPSKHVVKILLSDGDCIEFQDVLGVWRKVPSYLGRGFDGHIVFLIDTNEDIRQKWSEVVEIQFEATSQPILNHELCKWRYLLS